MARLVRATHGNKLPRDHLGGPHSRTMTIRLGCGVAKSGFAKEHLRSFIDRIERLEEERSALTADIREVYSEAKGQGFDNKIMRQIVRLRKMDKAEFQEFEGLLDAYKRAMNMID
jgi:uncharacterized protein (UPF0335 family)